MNNQFRSDFPIFDHNDYVYFDSAATSQKPRCVIEAEKEFYEQMNANPLRGLYDLSVKATENCEKSREAAAALIHAEYPEEIVFTGNTTEALNLVAFSYAGSVLKTGDEVVVSVMEHYSNLLPWLKVAEETGAKLRYLNTDPDGMISDAEINEKITDKTRIVALTHVSNVLGCVTPVRKIADAAHKNKAVVVVDAAQSVPHLSVDVQELRADFLAFSGHKMLGPMGIGVLYGRRELLEEMPPFLYGGEMIERAAPGKITYAEIPHKFEAGTVNAAGAFGLLRAVNYLRDVGYSNIHRTEKELGKLIFEGLRTVDGLHILGGRNPEDHCGIISFTIDGIDSYDAASILSGEHIAVRAGHHCAGHLMEYLKIRASVRVSYYIYNTKEEAEILIETVKKIREWLGKA